MILPSTDPKQRTLAQWGSPFMVGFFWSVWFVLRPYYLISAVGVFIIALVVSWLWFAYAFGISRYGRTYGLFAPWFLAILILWPMSTMLLSKLLGADPKLDVAMAIIHVTVLMFAGLWHASRASLKCDSHPIEWMGVALNLQSRKIESFPAQGSQLFFQVISARHDAKLGLIVTTNLNFSQFNQIFANEAVATVVVDRMVSEAEIFHMEGPSYRKHQSEIKNQKKKSDSVSK